MTIDDELLLELIKPTKSAEVGEDALLVKIFETNKLKYTIEESIDFQTRNDAMQRTYSRMVPDIIVTLDDGKNTKFAIEIENDLNWDFQASLRHAKDYQQKFRTIMIIPKEYQRFAPLYKGAHFDVYLWSGLRRYQCLSCGQETTKEGTVTPKCASCNNHNQSMFKLIGMQNANVEKF